MVASYAVKVDWSGNGDFAGTGEVVTSRVLARSTIRTAVGRDTARNLAPSGVGTASFVLNNRSRDYSPDNGSSPLTGLVGPGRLCDISAVGPPGSTSYGIYRGYIDGFDLDPGFAERSVSLSALDALGRFSGVPVSVPLQRGIRTGDAIGKVLDAFGWTGTRDLDAGVTTIEYFWLDEVDAMTALQDLVTSDGPPAILYIGPAGEVVFRDRHHRLTRSASLTSQATLSDTGAEPKHSEPFGYDAGFQDIVNTITWDIETLIPEVGAESVWQADAPIIVPAAGSVSFFAQTGDLIDLTVGAPTFITYTSTADFSFSAFTDIGGTTFQLTFTGTGTEAVVSNLQLFGRPIRPAVTSRVSSTDSASITKYGKRTWDGGVPPWAGPYDAAAIAGLIVGMRGTRTPSVVLTLKSGGKGTAYDTRLTQQLARDLSDRVTVVEAQSGVNRPGFIERIEHDIDWNSLLHTTRFFVDTAGTDSSTAATLFRFDTTGQGFNQGKFAT